MAAVRSLCSRAILVHKGEVCSDGPASTVVEEYVKMLASTAGGSIDLSNHPSRGKGCVPVIKGIRFINADGITTDHFGCGQPFTIALDLDPVRPLEQPHFGIGFDDALGQRIFSVATYLSEAILPPVRQPTTVYCKLPGLNVAPGTYILSLSAGSGHERLLDALHSAVAIEITATDYFGNGKLPHPSLGQILVRSQWVLDDERSQAAGKANGQDLGAAAGRRA
jgi:lipopolysaccharide transport system ATP-binding protein